uniref:non-specific serine/threonine protein kinase n=1 Tax=Panagrellus redivivus TaxID=6233 RepID=A0A7E4W8I0_PANRE
MPLGGIFGSGASGGPKPQPLQNETKKEKREKSAIADVKDLDKDCKGVTVKINKKSYTIDKKLAEGGFAIVYLVTDKHNQNYALKRQLIKDDPRQIEACRTESQIVKNLNGHKNLIEFIDFQMTVSKAGVYDYMLLTVFYKTSVLQLINNRLLANKWLHVDEILDMFCDMCEAVGRLHHSKTPVIHRDLKVENVLIDQRVSNEKPTYVLCDFGSATTKVFSRETHSVEQIDEEIRRYTTLSYRAPEMIDLFGGVPIDTKSDIWALGVLLYKLCYFALPFGESTLAIQNGNFTFPDTPAIPEEVKAMINFLLTSSAAHRPNIYQTAYLAFSAANRKCPVYNIQRSPRIELLEAVKIFRMRDRLGANYAKALEKAINEAYSNTTKTSDGATDGYRLPHSGSSNNPFLQPMLQPQVVPTPIAPVSGYSETTQGQYVTTTATTTFVNPRLRPKPATNLSNNQGLIPIAPPVSPRLGAESKNIANYTTEATALQNAPQAEVTAETTDENGGQQTARSGQTVPPTEMLDSMKVSQISTESSKSAPEHHVFGKAFTPAVSNASSASSGETATNASTNQQNAITLRSSAFKPYSLSSRSQTNVIEKAAPPKAQQSISNPFIESVQSQSESPSIMDDNVFGERFDELRRINRRNTIGTGMNQTPRSSRPTTLSSSNAPPPQSQTTPVFQPDPKILAILQEEPFAAAPFYPHQIYQAEDNEATG